MKTLETDIKNREFKPCYLLYGKEDYLKRVYKKQFIKALVPDDTMNYNHYQEADIDVHEIITICDTLPFFNDHRLVVVEQSGFFKKSQEELCEYLGHMPESTVLVFLENEIDKRGKLYKKVYKLGYVCELGAQSQVELERWIARYLARDGKKATKQTIDFLLSMVGDDMSTLEQEMEKLICFAREREVITIEDVQAVCIKQTESRIFDMFDAIAAGDQKRVFQIYYELVENIEPLMRILFMLGKQFNQLLCVKDMNQKGKASTEITKALGLRSDWVVRQLLKQGKRFRIAQLKQAVNDCVKNEELVKTGCLDEKIAVESILIKNVSIQNEN